MKLVISSYQEGPLALSLYEINEHKGQHVVKKINSYYQNHPSFVISCDDIVFTYDITNVVKLIIYQVKKNFFKGETLVLQDSKAIPGTTLTHLAYSKKNHLLMGCSYQDGSYFSIKIINNHFDKLINYEKLPIIAHSVNHNLNRAHCVFINNLEDEVGIVNIAQDAIFLYNLSENGLEYKDVILLPNNCGPRHAIFTKDDKFILFITEYSNEVMVVNRQTKEVTGKYTTVSIKHMESYGATLLLDDNEEFLYVSNRGEETIVKYQVNRKNGFLTLTPYCTIPVGGCHSRHMIMTSDGSYIISCNKNSNNATFINTKTCHIDFEIPYLSVSCATEIKKEGDKKNEKKF